MILKGSQRSGGADLALHLMNEFDNERVELATMRGTVADDLYGAFAEHDAIAAGTRCEKHLYSLSINPPQPLSRDQYGTAIDRIEAGLGLQGQPRAVVFHIKNGREHCHVVWSRIDRGTLKAIHISHDHMKLRSLARELGQEFKLSLPERLANDKRHEPTPKKRMTLGEKRQAEATGIGPEERRAAITRAYHTSDTAAAFRQHLAELGYELARGDQRNFVVVDKYGDVHSLARQIDGANTRAVKNKLAPIQASELPDVDDARKAVRARRKAADDASRDRFKTEKVEAAKTLEHHQALRRNKVEQRHQTLLTSQAAERLALSAAQHAEMQRPFTAAAMRVVELIQSVPGLRSVLAPILNSPSLSPAFRHEQSRHALQQRHDREKAVSERRLDVLAKLEARERRSLQTSVTRSLRNEERRKLKMGAVRDDQGVTRISAGDNPTLASDAAAGNEKLQPAKNWKERQQRIQADRGASQKRGIPGYSLKRDD